jgi:hypothetical protein
MPDLITDQFETIGNAADGVCDRGAHAPVRSAINRRTRGHQVRDGCLCPVGPSPDLAHRTSGQGAGKEVSGSSEDQWRGAAQAWNERALDRINSNRAAQYESHP